MKNDRRLTQVLLQLSNNFVTDDLEFVKKHFDLAADRTKKCFSAFKNYKYKDSEAHLNTDAYATFLYFLSNSIYLNEGPNETSDAIYSLNKMLGSLDLFYEVSMPTNFRLDHPVGTVLGRAEYGNYFSTCQNCTVGNNKGIYPTIGENVTMLMNSAILGKSIIGNNCVISSNTTIIDTIIPDNSIVFGKSPNLEVKSNRLERYLDKWL